MIFRTITDESTGAIRSIGLFGKSLSELTTNISLIKSNGIINTFFNTSTIDENVIANYNAEIERATANGATMAEKQQIMKAAMEGTNKSTAKLIETTNGATVEAEALTAAQEQSTLAAKAHSAALQAVSAAGNMLLMWAATQLISVFVKFIDSLHTTLEEQQEITKNLQSELSDIQSCIEDVNAELKTTSDRIDELNAKDSLSFVEKEELENLKKENIELQRRKDLLKEQGTRKQQEIADSVKKEYDKEYGSKYYETIATQADNDEMEAKRNRRAELDAKYNLTDAEYEELVKLKSEIFAWDTNVGEKTPFTEHIYETINAYNELNRKKKEGEELSEEEEQQLEEWRNELVDTAVDLNDYVDSYGIEDETSQSWHNLSAAISGCLYPADVQTKKFNEVFNGLSHNVQKELIALAQNGTLSVDDLSEGIKEKFEKAGFTADEVIEQIKAGVGDLPVKSPLSYTDTLSQIQSLSEGLDQLDQIYTDIHDKGDFDWSSILNNESFTKTFGEMGSSYDDFIRTVSGAPDDLDKCQSAFDDLLTSYLYSAKDSSGYSIMSSLTEETKQATVEMLTQMGVANALEVVEYQLTKNTKYLTDAQKEQAAICKQLSQEVNSEADAEFLAKLSSIDLANAGYEDIQMLINEAAELGITTEALISYALGKSDANKISIDTSADIDNLLSMAKATGVAADAVGKVAGLKTAYNNALARGDDNAAAAIANQMKKEAAKIQEDILKYKPEAPTVQYNGGSGYKSAAKDSAASARSEFSETVDFFERRIEVLDSSLDLLSAGLENVAGSFAKNSIIDAQLDINQEKIRNYTDALAMYSGEAQKILSSIPSDIAEKVRNGAVSLTDFVGDGNEAVVKAIESYKKWADKIADCNQKLTALQKTIALLELDRFNNIAQDFDDQYDLRDSAIGNIDKQIALLKEMGELVGKSYYEAQKSLAEKQLETLTGENGKRNALANELADALADGSVQAGSDEWLAMVKALADVDAEIIDCKKAIEEYDNAILQLRWDTFDRQQEAVSNVQSELSHLTDLFDDIDVADDSTGEWTDDALAKLGLLAEQYEAAQVSVSDYNNAINQLKQDYADGKYSATEYAEKLAELNDGQWEAVKASKSAEDAIVELNKARIDEIIEGIEKEKDAYRELVDAQIEALDAEKDLHDYKKSISEKAKNVTDLEQQISAMRNDTSAAGIAKRRLLEAELADAKEELEEAEYAHSIEEQKKALNQQYEDFETEKDREIEALKETLNNPGELVASSFDAVKQNAAAIGERIAQAAGEHGITVSDTVISPWQNGQDAIAGYGEALSAGTSAFAGNLETIRAEAEALQTQADNASQAYASLFEQKSDDFVTQLTDAYHAAENLYNMAKALGDLPEPASGGGHNVSAAANPSNSSNESTEPTGINNTRDDVPKPTVVKGPWKIVDKNGNVVWSTSYSSQEEAKNKLKEFNRKNGGGYGLKHYANGTRHTKGELLIKDEEGYELGLPKLASGNYALMPEGSQILTKAQTDNLFEWAKRNPVSLIPDFTLPSIADIANRNVQGASLNIDNLITVNGNIDDTNIKRMEKVARQAVNDAFVRLNKQLKYGGT